MKLLFASSNKNKVAEIAKLMPGHVVLLGLHDIGFTGEIPEPGNTIKENALLKAQYILNWLKSNNNEMPVFADDSGLEVSALNGEPGVYSARYAGTHGDHVANNKKLLSELQNQSNRKARFVTVITYMNGKETKTFEGEITGTIAFESRGLQGFGYDPLFIPTGCRSTFAEMTIEQKNEISHRARAVKKLIVYLKEQSF